jgi:hypothetical protein
MPMQVNFSKAQDITKDRLRMDRKPLLEEQDVLFMRATESGDDTNSKGQKSNVCWNRW